MERFKVSGQDLKIFYRDNVPLGRVFRDIEADLRGSNQVVCQYIINGLSVSEAQEDKFSKVTLDEIETLEYVTERSDNIQSVVLRSWIEALPELIQKTENLSKRMRLQGFNGLLKPIHDLVQNCEYLIDSTMILKSMLGEQFFVNSPQGWYKNEEESKKAVAEALRAVENKDFVLLADVLEYDLNHVLQFWLEHLVVLEKVIRGDDTQYDLNPKQVGSDSVGRGRVSN